MNYRAEIDGLRAVAVLSVMLFHAGVPFFQGGFVGVDVFFVISGYLITGIIAGELQRGTFSLAHFYERRVRRIVPALVVVTTVSFLLAFWLLLPSEMAPFARSVFSVFTVSSNILFKKETGYFDSDAELKPLLHTWSLSVEEQYYILYPFLLIVVFRFARGYLLPVLAALLVASFACSQYWVATQPAAAFFLLQSRAWELLVGALLALNMPRPAVDAVLSRHAPWLSLAGVAALAWAIFAFSEQTPFPGGSALLPTLGAAALIAGARAGTPVWRCLAWQPLVFVGLLSYSAYLWHQPVLAFARIHFDSELALSLRLGLLGLAFALAYLSWRFVEKPFRKASSISRRTVWWLAAVSAALLLVLGRMGDKSDGFEKLWLASQQDGVRVLYTALKAEKETNRRMASPTHVDDDGACRFNVHAVDQALAERLAGCAEKYGKGILVLGDSHAIDLFGVLKHSAPDHPFIVGLTQAGCRPHTPKAECRFDEIQAFLKGNASFSAIIYEQAGFYLLRNDARVGDRKMIRDVPLGSALSGVYPNDEFIRAVFAFLDPLAATVSVVWLAPRVEPHISEKAILRNGCTYSYRLRPGQDELFKALFARIREIGGQHSRIRVESQDVLYGFDFSRDLLRCDAIYWSDGDHFSDAGERYFGSRVKLLQAIGL